MKLKISPFLLLILFLVACSGEEPSFTPLERGQLIELTLNGRLSSAEVVERITEFDGNEVARYGVTFYAVTYRTEYRDAPIDSRGLLIVPEGVDSIHLLMYTHGTEIPSQALGADDITPSLYRGGTDDFRDVRNMGLGWAAAGFTVFMPDYIGYGLTAGMDHPYVYYPEMFISNIDGLLAVKSFLSREALPYDGRLFLTGWSQGAGACLSTHRYIQESYADEFRVVASSGLAGPYHFTRFALDIFNRRDEEVNILPIFSWAIYSMNKFSDIRRPTDQIFAYPVFDQMASIFVPSGKPALVFNGVFLNKILDGTDTAFLNEFQNNSFHEGWRPGGKVFLHHGDSDDIVPYFNSVDAEAGLTAAGGDVTFYTYPGGKHDTELGNYILNTLNDFNLLK